MVALAKAQQPCHTRRRRVSRKLLFDMVFFTILSHYFIVCFLNIILLTAVCINVVLL